MFLTAILTIFGAVIGNFVPGAYAALGGFIGFGLGCLLVVLRKASFDPDVGGADASDDVSGSYDYSGADGDSAGGDGGD